MTRASRRSSRRTRATDRYSGATPTAISAKSPCSERQQSSQSKSRRLDDGGGMVANAGEERITSTVPVRHLSKRTPIATCLTRKRTAPTAGELNKRTPVANRNLRKRAVPPTAAGHWTNTVPQRSSPRLNRGKRKRNAPDRFGPDPPRNQATVTNQSPAKKKASHGKNSRSATCHSSRRTVSERPQSANNAAVEPTATDRHTVGRTL